MMMEILDGGWIGPLRGSPPTSRYCPPSNFGGFGSAAIERVCVNPIPGFGETDGLRLSQCTYENGPMKPSGLGWTVRCLSAVRSFTRERAVAGRMMRVAEQGTGQLLFTLRGEAGWTRKQPTGLLPA